MNIVYHDLKIWPVYFEAVVNGTKPFEIRKNDRDFKVGDRLVLREFEPILETYTGRVTVKEVTFLLQGQFGLQADVCVMGLRGA